MKTLSHCTLTGVDERTDLGQIAELSRTYPIVEWGFLYSPKRQGQPGRYPSVDFLLSAFEALPAQVGVALHICGAGVPQFIDAEPVVSRLVQLVGQRGGRLQLNFNARTTEDGFTLSQLHACIAGHPSVQFITQMNGANADVWQALKDLPNHAVLFDASGGKGVSADQWFSPLQGVSCGYAGGLGPGNVAEELMKIRSVTGNVAFWIDMEGKLRDTDDWFDLSAARSVLEAIVSLETSRLASLDRHPDGRVRVVRKGGLIDADASWQRVRDLYTEADVTSAMEEVHAKMGISLWTIYVSPTDFPGQFVARRWYSSSVRQEATTDVLSGSTLDSVRGQLPGGLRNIGRRRGDEPQIVEVWI